MTEPRNPKPFALWRREDVTGASGTGLVATGAVFDDDTTVLRWRGDTPSTVVWPSLDAAMKVHGHDGRTRVVWLADAVVARLVLTACGTWDPHRVEELVAEAERRIRELNALRSQLDEAHTSQVRLVEENQERIALEVELKQERERDRKTTAHLRSYLAGALGLSANQAVSMSIADMVTMVVQERDAERRLVAAQAEQALSPFHRPGDPAPRPCQRECPPSDGEYCDLWPTCTYSAAAQEAEEPPAPRSCSQCGAQPWRPHRDDCPELIDSARASLGEGGETDVH